jgi:translation initiation factor IF-2
MRLAQAHKAPLAKTHWERQVIDGRIKRDNKIRLIRDGIVVYPTGEGASAELGSLKRYKDDVKEVLMGMECGLTVKNYNDIKAGDIVEA